MMDDKTQSWWQQISGKAILGRYKGKALAPIFHDELTFATWRKENPNGRVLRPEKEIAEKNLYAKSDWEKHTATLPVRSAYFSDRAISARTIIVGIVIANQAKAYPIDLFTPMKPLNDVIAKMPIVFFTNEDGKSIRCFISRVNQTRLEIFAKPGEHPRWFDSETGSEWDFSGKAVSGKWKGEQLQKLPILKDYWFDWKTYHPDTAYFRATP